MVCTRVIKAFGTAKGVGERTYVKSYKSDASVFAVLVGLSHFFHQFLVGFFEALDVVVCGGLGWFVW